MRSLLTGFMYEFDDYSKTLLVKLSILTLNYFSQFLKNYKLASHYDKH